MSCTPNVYAVESRSRANVTSAPGDAKGIAARPLPDILTYCYASQMMYVAAGKDYDVRAFLLNSSPPWLIELE